MTELFAEVAATDFDRATTLTPVAGNPGEFTAELDAGWSALVGVHGGYMCAIAARGAELIAQDRPVRTITTSFLRVGKVGPARLSVRELRRGRTLSTVVADLMQGEHVLTTSRLTLLTESNGLAWSSRSHEDLPPLEQCERFPQTNGVSHFGRIDIRLDPACQLDGSGDRALVRGYLRPLEARTVDSTWLAMATDCFPPPSFVRVPPPTGGVSIDLTTHIHRPRIDLGGDDWLTGSFEILDSSGGLAVEHGRIALRDGTIVAESFQTRLTTQTERRVA